MPQVEHTLAIVLPYNFTLVMADYGFYTKGFGIAETLHNADKELLQAGELANHSSCESISSI